MSFEEVDERFMRAALNEAKKALGRTSPNPAVGAVLVAGNKIIARGHHRRAGAPHAEMDCLDQLGGKIPKGSTLYVTLEPCSTTGRTGPCVEKIVRYGVQTVVVGTIDPNPLHQGRGITFLKNAGIKVRSGILADECASLNEAFNKWIVSGRPFVIAKCGMSLDGRLVRPQDEPRWITDTAARRHAQTLRSQVDAILVGAETVRVDDPWLTVRGVRRPKQPLRVVITRSGNLPRNARIFTDRFAKQTLVYRGKSLEFVLRDLGQKNITSMLIEGGGDVLGQALDQHIIDKVQIYLGPILTGGRVVAFSGRGAARTETAARLTGVWYQEVGQNICIIGYAKYRDGRSTE
jgi:diaminohydroxyphosphoribosylaminopyrimidine deaminase/5-amino-6-(5-phosphoribosylamino)uracil reductase